MRTRYLGACAVAAATLLAVAACGSSGKTSAAPATSSGTSVSSSGSSTGSGTGSKAPVKIGVIGAFTGVFGDTSSSDPVAIQAWASSVNAAGGLDGHPVQVFVGDDSGSASASLTQVKKLVEDDHVIAIVGIVESGLEGTWASYVDSKH